VLRFARIPCAYIHYNEPRVSKSTEVGGFLGVASPDAIFPLIGDLRRFNEWNPFAKAGIKLAFIATSRHSGRDDKLAIRRGCVTGDEINGRGTLC
jgi:hypothetical protein